MKKEVTGPDHRICFECVQETHEYQEETKLKNTMKSKCSRTVIGSVLLHLLFGIIRKTAIF